MADRPEMFGPTRGFSGMADSMETFKMLWGRHLLPSQWHYIWARCGDPVAYRLVSSSTSHVIFLNFLLKYLHCFDVVGMVANHLENLENSGNLPLVMEKSGKFWFTCSVVLQLQYSRNKHNSSRPAVKVDMHKIDCQ